jgi:hypothetical protein
MSFLERWFQRVALMARSVMARLKKWNWWIWLFVFAVIASVWTAIENGYANWVTELGKSLWAFVTETAQKPMRIGGLALVVGIGAFILFLLGISFLETSPALVRFRRRKPKPLTLEEKNEIEEVRKMWLGQSQTACQNAIRAVESSITALYNQGNLTARLLSHPVTQLRDAITKLDLVLTTGSHEPLREVQARLATVIDAYRLCAAWHNSAMIMYPTLLTDPNASTTEREYHAWVANHGLFALRLESLLKRSSFAGFGQSLTEQHPREIMFTDDRFDPRRRKVL